MTTINEQEDESRLLPPLSKGQSLESKENFLPLSVFSMCPPRYTEASFGA